MSKLNDVEKKFILSIKNDSLSTSSSLTLFDVVDVVEVVDDVDTCIFSRRAVLYLKPIYTL